MIKKRATIAGVLIYIAAVILITFAFENFKWHGSGCATDISNGICNGRLEQNRTEYFVSLSSCRSSLEKKYAVFLCASGPDPTRPEVMTYLAFRKVFYSEYGKVEYRQVPLSFRLIPLAAFIAIISSVIALGCISGVRKVLRPAARIANLRSRE